MKRKLSIIFTSLLLAMFMLLPASIALAAPTATFSPNFGPAGTVVSVGGTGWAGAEAITSVTVGGVPASHTLVVNVAGNLSGTITIPATTPGGWNVATITGFFSGAQAFTSAFYIQSASISITPYQGYSGTNVTVYGYGFWPGETIYVYYDGALQQTLSPASATWSVAIAASGALGYHTISATGTISGTQTASFRVIGPPPYIVSTTLGSPGDSITVSGYNFIAYESVYVTFAGVVITSGAADYNGYWSLSFSVPEKPAGSYIIDAYGGTTTAASVANLSFSVRSSLGLSQSSVSSGVAVTATGHGFRGNATITITISTISGEQTTTTDSRGYFTKQITTPLAGGNYTVWAGDGSGNISSASLVVTTSLAVSPTSGAVGETVSISGTGFTPNSQVTLTYDGFSVVTVTASSSGGFSATFKAPKSTAGTHTILASDIGGASARTAFSMEGQPPATPTLIQPSEGVREGWSRADVTFVWTEVSDPSGVTYNLQVARDAGMSTLLVNATGLITNSFEKPKLTQGDYYWRVQAVDNAGNYGSWTTPSSFVVAYPDFLLPLVGGLAGAAFIVALIFGVRLLFRRPPAAPKKVELSPELKDFIREVIDEAVKRLPPGEK